MVGSSAGAVVLIAVLAVLLAAGFVALWLRDKGRADEVSDDPGRMEPEVPETRARDAREGAADEPPAQRRERRH
jgi:hypothetical protein